MREERIGSIVKACHINGILLTFAEKHAFTAVLQLRRSHFLEANSCNILGSHIEAIQATQDPSALRIKLNEIGEPLALQSSIYADWKKILFELVRDQYDNCIVVCNMEIIDQLLVRTGDGIIVAPSQTLSNDEYNLLRSVSIKVIRHLGIIGACNVQFVLNTLRIEYYITQVNAGLSRSSLFASKATGYPLAYITAKLALGLNLMELTNNITNATCACFEPSLDYVIINIPRSAASKPYKFTNGSIHSRKSLDEVISIGRSFEEAFQQALRMIDKNITGFHPCSRTVTDDELRTPTNGNVFKLATALHQGYTIERLFELTKIDRWFLHKFASIIQFIRDRTRSSFTENPSLLHQAKHLGFSDEQIVEYFHIPESQLHTLYVKCGIQPFMRPIDTVSGEWPTE